MKSESKMVEKIVEKGENTSYLLLFLLCFQKSSFPIFMKTWDCIVKRQGAKPTRSPTPRHVYQAGHCETVDRFTNKKQHEQVW